MFHTNFEQFCVIFGTATVVVGLFLLLINRVEKRRAKEAAAKTGPAVDAQEATVASEQAARPSEKVSQAHTARALDAAEDMMPGADVDEMLDESGNDLPTLPAIKIVFDASPGEGRREKVWNAVVALNRESERWAGLAEKISTAPAALEFASRAEKLRKEVEDIMLGGNGELDTLERLVTQALEAYTAAFTSAHAFMKQQRPVSVRPKAIEPS